MISAEKTIQNNNLISSGQKIGVAVSGGIDSMCLLHFLNSKKQEYGLQLFAINIDHSIRENSKADSEFVNNYCKQNGIKINTFKVNVLDYCNQNKVTIEEGARILRYGVFESLIKKGIVDKIAIAHHKQDQVETILLNLIRGSGLKGVTGMEISQNGYIRPLLNTDKSEILCYQSENSIPFVEDQTNLDTDYSRNFLRQNIIPQIKSHWNNFENNLLSFSKICKQDNDYINSTISFDNLILENNLVKIPLSMFVLNNAIVFRLIRKGLEHLHALKDIEQKHLKIIIKLVSESDNGTRVNLPNGITAIKEYDYLTLTKKISKKHVGTKEFVLGKQNILNLKDVNIKKTKNFEQLNLLNTHIFDFNKLPKNAIWRTKQNGDMFTKFGGGTKKLKDYLIDKKIPARMRNDLALLCSGNEVLIVLGVEISDKIKIDANTKTACIINY